MSKLLERLDELEKAAQSAHYLDRETYEYERALWAAYPKLRAVVEAAQEMRNLDKNDGWKHSMGEQRGERLDRALMALKEDV